MKKSPILLTLGATALSFMASCEKTSSIGQSIVEDKIAVVVDSSFTLSGRTLKMERVQSRTIVQLFGKIDAPGYGKISSDVVTQFMPASTLYTDDLTAENIDSIMLYMYVTNGQYVGDSITPMGIEVYRLNKNLPSPIYSDFDPTGYYDKSDLLGSTMYNLCNNSNDTIIDGSIEVKVELPRQLGRDLFQAYLDNKENFSSPSAFVDNVFKGVYIKSSYGSGRLSCSSATMMTLFYHYFKGDTLMRAEGNYFAVTPEIITNNDLTMEVSPQIMEMVGNGENVIVAPAGMEMELRFPTPEIIASYRTATTKLQVLNTLSFFLPAAQIKNDFDIEPPTHLLLVLSKDKDKFFENNSLTDDVTSFYATYSAATGGYSFADMRGYLSEMLDKENLSADDYTFSLVPIYAEFESSNNYYGQSVSTLTSIAPYMSAPAMAKIKLDEAKIKLTYSTQTIEK